MRLLAFQHIACEPPGMLRTFPAADGVKWDAVAMDAGEPIPALEDYDALWVMGGLMDVRNVAVHPWLAAEKQAIRGWSRALVRLKAEADEHMSGFAENAEKLYRNFRAAVASARG